jgi:hypothetical protein
MQKIVINREIGGFGLSDEAIEKYAELKGIKLYKDVKALDVSLYYLVPVKEYDKLCEQASKTRDYEKLLNAEFSAENINRSDQYLVQTIELLKDKANTQSSKLKIVEIPDNVEWEIEESAGVEWVAEKHKTWS